MSRIAAAGARVVLKASGGWLWSNASPTRTFDLGNGTPALFVNGRAALLWQDVESAIKTNVANTGYRHNVSAVVPGVVGAVSATVDRTSLSEGSFHAGEPLVTSKTRGRFTATVLAPSVQQGSPPNDPLPTHSGSWAIENAQRVVTEEVTSLDHYIHLGKEWCNRIMKADPHLNLGLEAAVFDKKFRIQLRKLLKEHRGAGVTGPNIMRNKGASEQDKEAERSVKEAARWFPKDWVEGANKIPLVVRHEDDSYWYGNEMRAGSPAEIGLEPNSPGRAVHEYTHHLQQTSLGEVDELFQGLHRRLNKGVPSTRKWGSRYEPDDYYDMYTGYIVPKKGAVEVITTSFEMLLSNRGRIGVKRLLKNKHESQLLYLSLGALFHF